LWSQTGLPADIPHEALLVLGPQLLLHLPLALKVFLMPLL